MTVIRDIIPVKGINPLTIFFKSSQEAVRRKVIIGWFMTLSHLQDY